MNLIIKFMHPDMGYYQTPSSYISCGSFLLGRRVYDIKDERYYNYLKTFLCLLVT